MATEISLNLTPEQEEAIREKMRDGERERAFWNEHRAEFTEKYPKQVVIVKDGDVIAVVDDLFAIFDALKPLGLTPPETWIEYMNPEPRRHTL